jgi:hypothetical protein
LVSGFFKMVACSFETSLLGMVILTISLEIIVLERKPEPFEVSENV